MAPPKGSPKSGGRRKGSVNKATAEIREIASKYGPDAIEKLWAIAEKSDSDAAKVSAIREILDRAYGKPAQSMTIGGDAENPLMLKDQRDAAIAAAIRAIR